MSNNVFSDWYLVPDADIKTSPAWDCLILWICLPCQCPHQVLGGNTSSLLGFVDIVFPDWERLWAHTCTCYIYFQLLVVNGD